jgi:hypothetical protein
MTAAASQTYPGLRVLELATTIAGPFCSMILADLGADVVKIERPHKGDDARGMPPHWHGESTVFLAVNRNKRSVALDLKTRVGRDAFLRLVSDADVVVQSFRPGAAERLGLGYDDLLEHNASIVYCSVSAFGAAGSAAGLPGYDPLIQAFTGIMSMTGHAGGPPVRRALVDRPHDRHVGGDGHHRRACAARGDRGAAARRGNPRGQRLHAGLPSDREPVGDGHRAGARRLGLTDHGAIRGVPERRRLGDDRGRQRRSVRPPLRGAGRGA